ncbi:hypothetical protein JCGZ_15916 [Jatropha curcas]|uniref:rhamnogalacturonan endolyase n=1 Tax=Jatropha curcas TaxID=180498 RepID=A0A067LBL9_JATCU|nr:hypothetical protein JCGZ_15916 [Jatropha curcas]
MEVKKLKKQDIIVISHEDGEMFVILSGSSGFYTYAIYEHLNEWPAFNFDNTRIVFQLRKDKFRYMAIADDRQRHMPLPDDREEGRGQVLAYPEAVLLVNPIEPEFKGEVDDKYEYSCESRDIRVHGWISTDSAVGFWLITPSIEFKSGGPLKQYNTAHVGPTILSMINEVQKWPYDFPGSEDFPPSDQRGQVHGRLLVLDRDVRKGNIPANGAFVGLASPGDTGSWQIQSKGYQFWSKTDKDGQFTINNIRTGDYNIYAWVPGFIGDYKYDKVITISTGSNIDVDDLLYEPPRNGSTIWEIGIPDRSANEFYIPDSNPKYVNKLYLNHDRKKENNTYEGTTWQIKFKQETVDRTATYKLRLALATAHNVDLQVRINDVNASSPLFSTGNIGKDNTIARHGIHGLYRLFNVDVPGAHLVEGINTIFLTQTADQSPFQGIMYDYIRFEGPPSSNTIK